MKVIRNENKRRIVELRKENEDYQKKIEVQKGLLNSKKNENEELIILKEVSIVAYNKIICNPSHENFLSST